MTTWERIVSYVAVALTAGSVVALVAKHQGPLWTSVPDNPVKPECRDSYHMTCSETDEDAECAPGARATLRQIEDMGSLPKRRCIALLCQCDPPLSESSPTERDAGPPDVSLDAGATADGS